MTTTRFPHGISSFGVPILGGSQDISGNTWFVDGNMGNDGNEGIEWNEAFKTLAYAFSVSHADIARSDQKHWARRNTIYIAGDQFEETLIAFPQKTDIIGLGSDSGFPMAGIKGNHAPVNSAMGVRLFNIHFIPKTAAPIVTLVSTSGNVEFHGVNLDASGDAIATTAITSTACARLIVEDSQIGGVGSGTSFSTSAISLGNGAAMQTVIARNRIYSSGDGIVVGSTRSGGDSWIIGNFIKSTTICINDPSSTFHIWNNRGASVADDGTAGAGNVVGNVKLSGDNVFAGNDKTFIWPAYAAMA